LGSFVTAEVCNANRLIKDGASDEEVLIAKAKVLGVMIALHGLSVGHSVLTGRLRAINMSENAILKNRNFTERRGGIRGEDGHIVDVSNVRPDGIPEGWKSRPTKGNGGVEWYNPAKPNETVRIMPGNPKKKWTTSQEPYVRQTDDGGMNMDPQGYRTDKYDPNSHTSFIDFQYLPKNQHKKSSRP
jgi:hypothetical protein